MPARILVVDDEIDLEILFQQKYRTQIREGKYEFLYAHNGLSAMKALNSEKNIDLLLLDINMPEMDGLTLLNRLHVICPGTKAVIISAYGDMENIRTAMNYGAFDFISKPIDFVDLEATIQKSLTHVNKIKGAARINEDKLRVQKEKSRDYKQMWEGERYARRTQVEVNSYLIKNDKLKEVFIVHSSEKMLPLLQDISQMTERIQKEHVTTHSPEEQVLLEKVQFKTKQLTSTLTNIQIFSQLKQLNMELSTEKITLNKVLEEIIPTLQSIQRDEEFSIVNALSDETPEIQVNTLQIQQVLYNLLEDAIYCDEPGTIQITAEEKEAFLEITIINAFRTQAEINSTMQVLDQNFNPASLDSKKNHIDLLATKKLVELNNGKLSLKKGKDDDSLFILELPLASN